MEKLRLVPLSDYHTDCRLLEVGPGASLEEIKQAYRDQTKVWHPDRFSNDVRLQKKAEEKIIQINLAYRRLCGLSPYEQPVLSPAMSRSSSDSIAVFVALRRALRNSLTLISKPFGLLMRKAANISNGVFQSCRRERRSLAIATSAFVLGFTFAIWVLPRESETWVKINSLRQKTIEKKGTAQASAASPTMRSQTGFLTTSSPETAVSVPRPSVGTSSSPPVTRASVDVSLSETNAVTTPFWVGEKQITEKKSTQYASAWEKHWLKSFGGVHNPELTSRGNYIPISFLPHQNTFYYALPYNDVEQGFDPEAQNAISWFKQTHAEPGRVIARQQTGETEGKRPAHPAAVEPSHAITSSDESVMSPSATTREKEVVEGKRPANQAATKLVQSHRALAESIISASAAKGVTTYAPRPNYPQEARSHRIAGSGVCVVSVDPANGSVIDASMAQSTGSPLLDKSVLRTLRTWKFKPGTVSQVSIPVEFTTHEENR